MGKLTITGASDDLIEIDGDIREEFNVYLNDDQESYLSISDGTLLRVIYDEDGIWRFTPVVAGSAFMSKQDGIVSDDTMDVITLAWDSAFRWVTWGTKKAVKAAAKGGTP